MDKLSQFQNLIEITSLDKKIHGHMQKINEEIKRIDFLTANIEKRKAELAELTDQINQLNVENGQLEKDLFQKTSALSKTKEHLSMATSQKQLDSLEKEIENLEPAISLLEDRGFELLEELEEKETLIADANSFLSGSANTLKDITHEVEQIKTEEEKQIKILEDRSLQLIQACDKSFQTAYQAAQEKFRFKAPITFIQGRDCRECSFAIDEGTRDSVDRNFNLEFCPGCSRLICPLAATT